MRFIHYEALRHSPQPKETSAHSCRYTMLTQVPVMDQGQNKLKVTFPQPWISTLTPKTLFNGPLWFLKSLDFTPNIMRKVVNIWWDSVAYLTGIFLKLKSGNMTNTDKANKFSSIFPLLGNNFLIFSRSWLNPEHNEKVCRSAERGNTFQSNH